MNQQSWIFKNIQLGAFLGVLSIILGAFAAHQLEKIADFKVVQSFKTGVQYQFLQSFFALIVAVMGGLGWLNQKQSKILWITNFVGILFFSFSIYILAFLNIKNLHEFKKFVGPITPLGGLILITTWLIFIVFMHKNFKNNAKV